MNQTNKILLFILTLCFKVNGGAQMDSTYVLLPDSSNFVYASLLVASPGEEGFYVLGHSALRLQCPSYGLDYCFSFDTEEKPGFRFNVLLLLGAMSARYEAVPYDEYIVPYKDEGRLITEYMLNLTLHEKQELWRLMDERITQISAQPFDFLSNNCTSMLYRCVSTIMECEDFDFTEQDLFNLDNRDYIHMIFEQSPWIEFMTITTINGLAKEKIPVSARITPQLWGQMLTTSHIVGLDGSVRDALVKKPHICVQGGLNVEPIPVTPVIFFLTLLIITIVITFLEVRFFYHKLGICLDFVLRLFYVLFSFYLLWTSVFCVFGIRWNWLFIVFNPVPIIIYCLGRKKKWYSKIHLLYCIVIIGLMIFFPLYMHNLELPHLLWLSTYLIRNVVTYYRHERL